MELEAARLELRERRRAFESRTVGKVKAVRQGTRRSTHCFWGHEFNEQNTYIKPNGCRDCRPCKVFRARRSRI